MARHANMSKNPDMEIGAVIRKIRQSKRLTLEEVAYAAGTDAGNLSRIERGLQRCVHELLEGIAAGLGLSVAELYLQAESPEQSAKRKERQAQSPSHISLFAQYENLTESNQKLVGDFVQLLLRNQRQK